MTGAAASPTSRPRRLTLAALVLVLVAAACTGDDIPREEVPPPEAGGTLRVAVTADLSGQLDPQRVADRPSLELFRCCLLRTLLSYNGRPFGAGGAELRPDLAVGPPQIGQGGRLWTFRLRPGIRYAPPHEQRSVVAADVVRALERTAEFGGSYTFLYQVIEGFDAFAAGRAKAIEGLRAPDDHTLVIRLRRPVGDFGHRMAHPAAAPIPPRAAEGHEADYGQFLAASGPYMIEGAGRIRIDLPPDRRSPADGYRPGRRLALIRNPSWEDDPLRLAYPDRIEVRIGVPPEEAARLIDASELELRLDGPPPAPQIRKYVGDPQLQGRLHSSLADGLRYLSMNVAVPPLDDPSVRRAVSLAIDKAGLLVAAGDPHLGEPAGHIVPHTVLEGRHADYDPYATPRSAGDPQAAREAMSGSDHDTDGDGLCDRRCGVVLLSPADAFPFDRQAELIAEDLREVGLEVDVSPVELERFQRAVRDPAERAGLILPPAWNKEYPDAGSYLRPLFAASAIGPDGCCNTSMVGASPRLLASLRLRVDAVPSVDDRLARCAQLLDEERLACWVDLEEHLMEEVVPVVPLYFTHTVDVVSGAVTHYAFDQYAGVASLDRLALADDD